MRRLVAMVAEWWRSIPGREQPCVGNAAKQPFADTDSPNTFIRAWSVWRSSPSGPFAMKDVSMAWDSGTRAENWTEYRATESPKMLATELPEWLITSSVASILSPRVA
jgi:hypothetical protein